MRNTRTTTIVEQKEGIVALILGVCHHEEKLEADGKLLYDVSIYGPLYGNY